MADTLLAIVQKVCGRLSLIKPSSVIGSVDQTTEVMLDLVTEEGEELMRAYDWSPLVREGATVTLQAAQESYPLPTDFDRLVRGTAWDRSVRWLMQGPDSPQMARARRESLYPSTAFRRSFRQVGNMLTVYPIPVTSGDVIAFDYVSNLYAASASGALQGSWNADTDVPVLPSNLFILGLRWRWLDMQGMASDTAKANYAGDVRRAIARDMGGGRTINMGVRCGGDDLGNADGVTAAQPTVVLTTDGGVGIAID